MTIFYGRPKILRKILVATDGSISSLIAEETAVMIAKKAGDCCNCPTCGSSWPLI